MQREFRSIAAGIFRASNGLCYTKLESPVTCNNESFNAVVITSGQLKNFEDTSIVEDFRES